MMLTHMLTDGLTACLPFTVVVLTSFLWKPRLWRVAWCHDCRPGRNEAHRPIAAPRVSGTCCLTSAGSRQRHVVSWAAAAEAGR